MRRFWLPVWLAALAGCGPGRAASPAPSRAAEPPQRGEERGHVEASGGDGALRIDVVASKWTWRFVYDNGHSSNVLRVPAERASHITLKSKDTTHRLRIPDLDIEHELSPYRAVEWIFEPREAGTFSIANGDPSVPADVSMDTCLVVMPTTEFEDWYRKTTPLGKVIVASQTWKAWVETIIAAERDGRTPPDAAAFVASHDHAEPHITAESLMAPAAHGKQIWKQFCKVCHTDDGYPKVGPSHMGLWQRTVAGTTMFSDGSMLLDHYHSPLDYLREQILAPSSAVVRGYPPAMPSFRGVLGDSDIDALIAFFIALDHGHPIAAEPTPDLGDSCQ